jgi:hypothetical protein
VSAVVESGGLDGVKQRLKAISRSFRNALEADPISAPQPEQFVQHLSLFARPPGR